MVWATGVAQHAWVEERVALLPFADRIRVEPFIDNLGAQLHRVSLAIARSGAMFLAELAAAGVPAVLVPFPGAAGSHQTANAQAVQAAGAAVMREESELQAGELWELACGILRDESRRLRMAAASGERGAPDAAERIALELLELIASGPSPRASGLSHRGTGPAPRASR